VSLVFFFSFSIFSTFTLMPEKKPGQDCTFCRLSGGAVGIGGGYFALRKAIQLQKKVGTSNKAVALGVTGVCK
jgi:hypothetical protein